MTANLAVFRALLDDITKLRETRGINVRGGRKYTQVQDRVEAFRRHFGDSYGIETSITCENFDKGSPVVAECIIRAEDQRVVAMGHAVEFWGNSNVNSTSAIENAETSAIGRALATLGVHGGEFASANEMDAIERKTEAREGNGSRQAPRRTQAEISANATLKTQLHDSLVESVRQIETLPALDKLAREISEDEKRRMGHGWHLVEEAIEARRLELNTRATAAPDEDEQPDADGVLPDDKAAYVRRCYVEMAGPWDSANALRAWWHNEGQNRARYKWTEEEERMLKGRFAERISELPGAGRQTRGKPALEDILSAG